VSALDDIRQRAEAATEGPWDYGTGYSADGERQVTTKADKAEFLALSLNDTSGPLWLVDNTEVIPAVTGDGPKAKANAEFIAHARTDIPRLLGALDAVLALADEWNTLALGDQFYARHIRAAVNDALEAGK